MVRIRAHYHLAATPDAIEARAGALALEQSIEMPLEAVYDAYVREDVVARVEEISELEPGRFRVVLSISTLCSTASASARARLSDSDAAMR